MARGSRIFGILDMELSRRLSFCFSIDENLTRPGSTTIRRKDRFRFSVWVRNDSAIPLRNVRGTIHPTALASFESTCFEIAELPPACRRRLASGIEAEIIRGGAKGCVRFHLIGEVTVSTSADLSRFRFEKSRPLTYVQSA
jgi:hypothetical protein